MSLMLLCLLTVGCRTDPCGPPKPDAVRYVDAIRAGIGGLSECSCITDPDVHSDCVAWIALAQAEAGDAARAEAACGGLPSETHWRGECFFLVADAIKASGARAKAMCAQAAPFTEWCLAHVAQRRLGELLADLPRGQEAAFETQSFTIARDIAGLRRGERIYRRSISRALADRPDDPFDMATCGTATEETCSRAYLERLLDEILEVDILPEAQSAGWARLAPLCDGQAVTVDAASAAGLPRWTEAVDEPVQSAWAVACQRMQAQRLGGQSMRSRTFSP